MKHIRLIGKNKLRHLPKPAIIKALKSKKEPPANTTMTM